MCVSVGVHEDVHATIQLLLIQAASAHILQKE